MTKPRKFSFRYLLIDLAGRVFVVTQDQRRRRNAITGLIQLRGYRPAQACEIARLHGCSVVVRPKRAA